MSICQTPQPPYVCAIFTSIRTSVEAGYEEMNEATFQEIQGIEGFLGVENFRTPDGFGVNVSYWKDMESLKYWRDNALHQRAKALGKKQWYQSYKLRIAVVEREYGFEAD